MCDWNLGLSNQEYTRILMIFGTKLMYIFFPGSTFNSWLGCTGAELLFSPNFSRIVEMCFRTVKYQTDISFGDDKSSSLPPIVLRLHFMEARSHTKILYEYFTLRILFVTLQLAYVFLWLELSQLFWIIKEHN